MAVDGLDPLNLSKNSSPATLDLPSFLCGVLSADGNRGIYQNGTKVTDILDEEPPSPYDSYQLSLGGFNAADSGNLSSSDVKISAWGTTVNDWNDDVSYGYFTGSEQTAIRAIIDQFFY